MSTELTAQQTFEEKLKDRIKGSIGELMPDEVLKSMIERTLEEVFLKDTSDGYGHKQESVIKKQIKELMGARVSAAVEQWLKDNPDKVSQVIQQCFAENMVSCVANSLNYLMSQPFQSFANAINERLGQLNLPGMYVG